VPSVVYIVYMATFMLSIFIIVRFWDFNDGEDSSRSLLGRDTVWCCGRVSTFRRNLLPPSSGWKEWRWERRLTATLPSPLHIGFLTLLSSLAPGLYIFPFLPAPFASPWRWRQQFPPKRSYPTTSQNDVEPRKPRLSTRWLIYFGFI
jgi:hypothetical protein